ncbi:MAG: MarR family winged helix-turn-helix transcriptional regulator [Paracoccaceae bacterium]
MNDESPGQPQPAKAGPTGPGLAEPGLAELGLSGFAPYLMNRIMGRYNASLRAEMAGLGLTTPKMRALAVLSVIEAPSIGALAVHTVTDQSTLSRALDQLAAGGLIRRQTDPDDSRTTRCTITDAGRAAFDRLWPHMAQAQARMFRGIPEAERGAFVATLHKMLANIRKHEI